ncbi:MAG: tetraacyldisaccharide 4'-kinase [Gemmatimonadaceae bacterium]
MRAGEIADQLWRGDGWLAAAARLTLAPLEAGYGAATALRNALYDRGMLRILRSPLPAVSIGNLTVGGTGKTPVSAWIASELRAGGARPAIVMRGYGDDEPDVHRRLHPDIPVIASRDRLAGAYEALSLGADIVVLDDAFQHRRLNRNLDIVLISADAWTRRIRLLPAGPWREGLASLERASIAVITRKAASHTRADSVRQRLHAAFPTLPVATMHLALDEIRRASDDERRPLASLDGAAVAAVAGVGDPWAYVQQLELAGARVRPSIYPDHFRFDASEVRTLAASVRADELPLCTLKDAVKLAPLWPRAAPALWYVSQRVVVEDGVGALHALLEVLLRARHSIPVRAGPAAD